MTDEEIRKLIGEKRWQVIQGILDRERKIAQILERAREFTEVMANTVRVKEVCELLRVSRQTLFAMRRDGRSANVPRTFRERFGEGPIASHRM